MKFEFPIDKSPRPSASNGWFSFLYKDWPQIREQFSEYVKQLPGKNAAVALLDAGSYSYRKKMQILLVNRCYQNRGSFKGYNLGLRSIRLYSKRG